MRASKRRGPLHANRAPGDDVEIACRALSEIKRQMASIARVGGGEPTSGLLLAAVDDCAEAVIVCDGAAEIRMANGQAARMLGLTIRELKSLTVWDITYTTAQVDFEALWREFLRAGRQRGQYTLRTRDGLPVEVAYCAEAHLLPGQHVSVLRPPTGP